MATIQQQLDIVIAQLADVSYANKLNNLVDVASCISALVSAINLTAAGLALAASLVGTLGWGSVLAVSATSAGTDPIISNGDTLIFRGGAAANTETLSLTGGVLVVGATGAFASHLSVPGAGANSEQFGATALAAGIRATALGFGASAAALGSVAIGDTAAINAAATGAVLIGDGGTTPAAALRSIGIGVAVAPDGLESIAIGDAATAATTGAIAIGDGANASVGIQNIAIGVSANVTASGAIAIGQGAVSTNAEAIALGRAATTTAVNQLVVGGSGSAVSTLILGSEGDTDTTPVATTWRITNASGTNIAGADLTIVAGRSTGNAAGGDIIFQTSLAGGAGAALNAAATVLTCQANGSALISNAAVFDEASSAPNPLTLANQGEVWVIDTSPTCLVFTDSAGDDFLVGGTSFKSYTFTTQGIGNGDFYTAGFYEAPAAEALLDEGGASTTLGGADGAVGAHAFIVAGGAGTVPSGTVAMRISGTSITDAGVRTGGVSEDIVVDITTLALDDYVESTLKWIGTVTWTLVITSGAPATFSLNINYGFAKYDDLGNRNFTLTDFEIVTLAGSSDANYDAALVHHKTSGWAFSAAAFIPGADQKLSDPITQLSTTYGAEHKLINNEYSAFKRTGLSTAVNGGAGEGFVVRLTTSVNNAIESTNIHVGARLTS